MIIYSNPRQEKYYPSTAETKRKKIIVSFEIFSAGKFDGIRFSYNSD